MKIINTTEIEITPLLSMMFNGGIIESVLGELALSLWRVRLLYGSRLGKCRS